VHDPAAVDIVPTAVVVSAARPEQRQGHKRNAEQHPAQMKFHH
jgi:hypothetical protein